MTRKKAQEKYQTFSKIYDILTSSKLKVIHLLKSTQKEASHNIMLGLLSRYTFEYAKSKYGFKSDLYENDFDEGSNINIVFLQEKIALSNTYEKIVKAFFQNKKNKDANYIVADFPVKDSRLKDCKIINGILINALVNEIIVKYSSKNYKNVVIYSNVAQNGVNEIILPMSKMKIVKNFKYQSLVNNEIQFYPSIQEVIELSYHDYTKCLITYFYFNSKYIELKNTLVKYEGSIKGIEEKLEEIKKTINKIRQNKITEEIILSSAWGKNV